MSQIKYIDRDKYARWRRANKITLKQVAEYIGVSTSQLCRFEGGTRDLKWNQLKKYDEFIRKFEENGGKAN